MSVKPTLVELILNATAAGKSMLTAANAAAQKTLLSLVKSDVGLGNVDNTSDANKPVSTAAQTALDAKADLVGGVVPSAQIPAIAITEYLGSVANQAAMLALTGDRGDWCLRSDTGTTWVLSADDSSLLASWVELNYPTAPVTSVNGETGAVTLSASDVGAAATSHTHAQSDITDLATDLAAKAAAATTITAGTGLSGGGDLSANRTLTLANTAVTAGSYTSADITVDAQGRITAAADGSGGGSPGGSSGQMQYNNAGAFGGAAQVIYATTGTHVVITASGATLVPLCIKGAASQSSNLQEWQNSAGTLLGSIGSDGRLKIGSTTTYLTNSGVAWRVFYNGDPSVFYEFGNGTFRVEAYSQGWLRLGNVTLFASSGGTSIEVNNGTTGTLRDWIVRNLGVNGSVSAGGGVGIAFIANATTVPTTNPTGGGILYCESGALKFRGSSGTVTTLGAA